MVLHISTGVHASPPLSTHKQTLISAHRQALSVKSAWEKWLQQRVREMRIVASLRKFPGEPSSLGPPTRRTAAKCNHRFFALRTQEAPMSVCRGQRTDMAGRVMRGYFPRCAVKPGACREPVAAASRLALRLAAGGEPSLVGLLRRFYPPREDRVFATNVPSEKATQLVARASSTPHCRSVRASQSHLHFPLAWNVQTGERVARDHARRSCPVLVEDFTACKYRIKES